MQSRGRFWAIVVTVFLVSVVGAYRLGGEFSSRQPGGGGGEGEVYVPSDDMLPDRLGASSGTPELGLAAEDRGALLVEARRLALHRLPQVVAQVEAFRERLMLNALLEREAYAGMDLSEERLRKFYDENRGLFRRERQVRVHHFRFPSRQEAEDVARRVSNSPHGAFELGEKMSREDPQGRRWGDLGFFGRDRFPGEVGEQLFRLRDIGTTIIVEQGDGFHLFCLMDVREAREFAFDEVRGAVRDRLLIASKHNAAQAYLTELKGNRGAFRGDMLLIPGGTAWLGSTEEEIDESLAMSRNYAGKIVEPRRVWFEDELHREVRVAPFYMDVIEATLRDYRNFVRATGREPLPGWIHEAAPSEEMPVVGVNQGDAAAFCAWVGKRLPTADEWEFAARGEARRTYPWGNGPPDGTQCNYADRESGKKWADTEHSDGFAALAPVGRFPLGATPEGLLDMSGNAREWTSTRAPGIEDPRDHRLYAWFLRSAVEGADKLKPQVMHLVKGGAWDAARDDMRASDYRVLPSHVRVPSLGFRCARDAQ